MDFQIPILDRLQDSFGPLDESDVRELEAELGVTFPEDYAAFLMQYNRAYMQHPMEFDVRVPGPFVEGGTFDNTLGNVKKEPYSNTACNIRWNVEALEGRIPDGLVAFANSGADPICIGLTPSEFGRIYLWDSVDEGADDNTYLVADSFTEFLGLLSPGDESYLYVEELPIFRAIERGEVESVQGYLADGGKVDCRNAQGQTLLMCAAHSSWPRILRLLIDHGANLDTCDADDCTPVYHAAIGQSHDSLQMLLKAGANPHYCDHRGQTLVKLLDERSYFRIARTLKKHLAHDRTRRRGLPTAGPGLLATPFEPFDTSEGRELEADPGIEVVAIHR